MTYALDTNTISYWIINKVSVVRQLDLTSIRGDDIVIPPSSYYEIRRGFKHKPASKKELAFSLICRKHKIGKMNLAIWEEAANIYAQTRKAGKPIEDTDILLAAFCLVNGYTLVTSNTKHFVDVMGLQLVDWLK